jgi:uncharacterized short protein YbdD (DUF466 family)
VNVFCGFVGSRQKLEQTQISSNWGMIKSDNQMVGVTNYDNYNKVTISAVLHMIKEIW